MLVDIEVKYANRLVNVKTGNYNFLLKGAWTISPHLLNTV